MPVFVEVILISLTSAAVIMYVTAVIWFLKDIKHK